MQITGKIVYVDLSGGFWGIESDDGQQYNPGTTLPDTFKEKDIRIKANVSPLNHSVFLCGVQM
ncbi:MAG: hypothetical protein R3B93_27865 [Bacteroidia bacterium]